MKFESLMIRANGVPTIEIDPQVKAAYIRFSNEEVFETLTLDREGCLVTADVDAKGEVIGIELIGVEFSIKAFRAAVPLEMPSQEVMEEAKWQLAA